MPLLNKIKFTISADGSIAHLDHLAKDRKKNIYNFEKFITL